MKPKTLILMILAVVCGLVASYMTSQLIAQNKEKVWVLQSKKKITQWSTIRNAVDDFQPVEIEKKTAHNNALLVPAPGPDQPKWVDDLKGRRFKTNMEAGDHLTEDHLQAKNVTGIDTMLDKGKRAMSVAISADRAVGFFVVPGSKVDVVQTVTGVSNILLENVLVLAIDLNTSRPDDRAGMVGGTATLQLENNDQVLKLATARDKGAISLVMRPPGDDSKSGSDDAKNALLPLPPPPPPVFDEPGDVKTVSGSDTTTPTSSKRQSAVKYMDIMNGSQFFRVEATQNDDGKTWSYAIKNYDEVMNIVREREEKRSSSKPPTPAPSPDEGTKKDSDK
jgi:Flp pilus assembly protein CpaB